MKKRTFKRAYIEFNEYYNYFAVCVSKITRYEDENYIESEDEDDIEHVGGFGTKEEALAYIHETYPRIKEIIDED